MPVIVGALVIGFGVPLLLAPDASVAMSASLASFGMLLTYEWTHYLIHSRYRPKTAFYRRLWRTHRWHHYRNENYWFGVTMHLGDRILRTYPDKDSVELSPTARALDQRPANVG
jgi:sterol desaturase/sphingolipid hydroxylase (fatty acid hydroxylase superfamily)